LALFVSPDIAALLSNRSQVEIYVFEERIAQLRLEVDRLQSRQYARAGDLNVQLQELISQQEQLARQQDYIRALAGKAVDLGLEPGPADPAGTAIKTSTVLSSLLTDPDPVGTVTRQIATMQADTLGALTALSTAADQSTHAIVKELKTLGLAADLELPGSAVGGPFLPPVGARVEQEQMIAANAVISAFDRFEQAREAIQRAPIYAPLTGRLSISSPYGNRKDPFRGNAAFHSGLDIRAPQGKTVSAAGAGEVIFAGWNGGYGKFVAIKHPNGVVTRYAHMSKVLVSVGQMVTEGEPVGRVGSTGRSTGPHLHFEVRINDKTADPNRFITAGRRLSRFM
ncbi:MAG: peptidoglycan DD-metalloendopeptidase family protein, partial [Alphaproteobacteria bacterium]|nr:peptidoglycan DD-metalloendopeptidase family protein [Alphaproteobacteria bacterium]